jgi:hypothetical protein
VRHFSYHDNFESVVKNRSILLARNYEMEIIKLSGNLFFLFYYLNPNPSKHRLNMEFDLQSLFGLLCTAVLCG